MISRIKTLLVTPIFLAFILAVLTSCELLGPETDEKQASFAPVVPVIGYSPQITTQMTVDSEMHPYEVMYFVFAPSITGFDQESEVADGESYTQQLLGVDVTVSVTRSGDDWVYQGSFDGGWSTVTYSPSEQTFSFEQLAVIQDPNKRFSFGSGSDDLTFVTWTKGDDIQLSEDGDFQAMIDFAVYGYQWEGYTNSLFRGKAELYRGVLSGADRGVGVRSTMMATELTGEGTGIPDGTDVSASQIAGAIDAGQLDLYHDYFQGLETSGLSGGELLLYRYDDGRENTNSQDETSVYVVEQGTDAVENHTPSEWAAAGLTM